MRETTERCGHSACSQHYIETGDAQCVADPFAGLEDESEWSGDTAMPKAEEVTLHIEKCNKCRGSGNWRPGFPCFKCKGKGKLYFKTSAKQRASGRKSSAKAKEKKAGENQAAFLEWLDTEPDVRDWIVPACAAANTWAQSMYQGGLKYGALTDNMVAAIRKAIARDDEGREGVNVWCESDE